jgi:hypothetical protein
MKKILLTLFCLSFLTGIFAQSFVLSYNSVNIAPGGTLQIMGDPTTEIMEAHINITNNADVAKTVKVKKVVNQGDTLTGTLNSFCWGLCYPDTTYISPYPQTIQPGQVSDMFYGDYRPRNIPGVTKVMYVFFDVDNRNDSVSVVVEYNASPASVGNDLLSQVKFSAAYPNPAINVVHVDYTVPSYVNRASIVISNMLGSKVKEVELEVRSGKAQITVSDLINGIYFYSLIADEKLVLTRKFVVKR